MEEIPRRKFRSDLDAAICYLIGMGIIEKDVEVAEATGASKGNLSSFKNSGKYSNNFKTKFQEKYKLNLSDFNPETYDPVAYVQKKKPGPSQEPDLLTLLKTARANLETAEKAALKLLDSQKEKDPVTKRVALGKKRGHINPQKKSESKNSA